MGRRSTASAPRSDAASASSSSTSRPRRSASATMSSASSRPSGRTSSSRCSTSAEARMIAVGRPDLVRRVGHEAPLRRERAPDGHEGAPGDPERDERRTEQPQQADDGDRHDKVARLLVVQRQDVPGLHPALRRGGRADRHRLEADGSGRDLDGPDVAPGGPGGLDRSLVRQAAERHARRVLDQRPCGSRTRKNVSDACGGRSSPSSPPPVGTSPTSRCASAVAAWSSAWSTRCVERPQPEERRRRAEQEDERADEERAS